MSRILLLGCSGRKHETPGLVPAWFRYDGVLFRVCKSLERRHSFPDEVTVRILSAAFGVIGRDTPIPHYERRMNAARARELHEHVTAELCGSVFATEATEIFVAVGLTYRAAIGKLPDCVAVTVPTGGIGQWQAQLHAWLRAKPRQAQLSIGLEPRVSA